MCISLRFGVSCQDNEKRTPLHAAAYLGDAEIIELLILSGKSQPMNRCIQPSIICPPLESIQLIHPRWLLAAIHACIHLILFLYLLN